MATYEASVKKALTAAPDARLVVSQRVAFLGGIDHNATLDLPIDP